MSRNDDGFNLDDMMEIFGDAVAAAPKASVATAKAAAGPAVETAPPPSGDPGLTADEMALLEAYEKQKHEKRQREDEARRKKDEEAKRILEDYEKAQREAREKEERDRAEREAKRQKELEELKRKEEFKVDAQRLADEERKIIEDFEREAEAQKQRQAQERQAKEALAQAELQRLAEQQKTEEAHRQADEAQREEALNAKAEAVTKKDSRLMELLAKAQQDLKAAALPPLPGPAADAAPAGAAAGSPSAADVLLDIEQREADAFCAMLDETRKSMFTFLAPLIGIKAATNMLTKTVEKARSKAPVVLKDANWKMDGSLRDDGSVDNERLLKNVASLAAGSRVTDFLAGLRELVGLRQRAVEAGLGATTAGEMRNRVLATREIFKTKPWPPEWVDLFFKEVIG